MLHEAVDRHFLALPPRDAEAGPGRRIWEVEPDALVVALGVLVEKQELEALLLEPGGDGWAGREDVMLARAVRKCAAPCAFAETVEALLEARARPVARQLAGSPMAELAAWWMDFREVAGGRRLASLLWILARDRRLVVRPLFRVVRSDCWVRALRVLGDDATE